MILRFSPFSGEQILSFGFFDWTPPCPPLSMDCKENTDLPKKIAFDSQTDTTLSPKYEKC